MNQPPELNSKDIRTISYIFAVAVLMIALVLLWASRSISAQEKPKAYTPTEVQALKLKVTQQEAQLLQAQMQNIQRQFQDKVTQLMGEANKVKLENSWPPETVFNPDLLTFSAPPPKEEKKP